VNGRRGRKGGLPTVINGNIQEWWENGVLIKKSLLTK
jgi:hypothetical protein